jgi:hypothetical protein
MTYRYLIIRSLNSEGCKLKVSSTALNFFTPNATTCPLWTSSSPLPVVAEVEPTSEVGTPMRRSYVAPIGWMVIYEYEVPGGALNLSSTKLPRPWSPLESSPSRKNRHGRTGNRTRDLIISSQKLWPLDDEDGPTLKCRQEHLVTKETTLLQHESGLNRQARFPSGSNEIPLRIAIRNTNLHGKTSTNIYILYVN